MRLMLVCVLAALNVACERKLAPTAPVPASPTPVSSSGGAAPPISNAAPSGRVSNAAPAEKVAPVPTTVPPAAPADPNSPPVSDVDLRNAVRQAISGDPTLSPAAQRIDVQVTDGVVRLSGTLAAERDRDNLRAAVARVRGVKAIDNRVLVKSEGTP